MLSRDAAPEAPISLQLALTALQEEPIGVALLDAENLTYAYANAALRRLVPGRPIVGQTHAEVFPDTAEKAVPLIRNVAETGEPLLGVDVPWRISRSPGAPAEDVCLRYDVRRIHADGRYWCLGTMLETTSEVAERREQERSWARVETILAQVTDAFVSIDREWRYTYVNPRAAEILGRPADELLGMNMWQVFPDALGTLFEEHHRRAMEGREAVCFEDYYAPLDLWVEARLYPTDDGIAAYFTEVSERRRSQEGFRFQAQAMRSVSDAIVAIGADRTVRIWNAAAEHLYGVPASEAVGRPVGDSYETEWHSEEDERAAWDELESRGEWHGELTQRLRDGRRISVEMSASVICQEDGSSNGYLAVSRDVTAARRRERLAEGMGKIATAIHSTLDSETILRSVLSLAAAAVGCDEAGIAIREPGGWRPTYGYNSPPHLMGRLFRDEEFPVGTQAALLRDVVSEAEVPAATNAMRESFGRTMSVLSAPLLMRDEVAGIITLQRRTAEPFRGEDREFARQLASSLSLALENARLFEEQLERAGLAHALNEIDSLVNETLDFEESVSLALPAAAQALGADSAVAVVRDNRGWLVMDDWAFDPPIAGRVYAQETPTGGASALRDGRVTVIEDVRGEHSGPGADVALGFGISAMLIVPLVRADEAFGLLYFNMTGGPHRWRRQQIDFASAVGSHLSLAAQNAALFEDERERAMLSVALNNIDTVVHSALQADAVLADALQMGAEAAGADRASIALLEGEDWVVHYQFGFSDAFLGSRFPASEADYIDVMRRDREPIVFEYEPGEPDVVESGGGREEFLTNLVAPLIVRGEVFGLMFFNRLSLEHEFTRGEVDFARKLAESVSLALENLRLVEEERRSSRLAHALNRVNELLLSTMDPEEMLDLIVAECATALGAPRAALVRPEDDGWTIDLAYGFGEEVTGMRFAREEMPAVTEVARSREPMLVADSSHDARMSRDNARRFGLRAAILLPLSVQTTLLGVLTLIYLEPMAFHENDVAFARQLSTAITLALEGARLYQTERNIAETLQETLLVMPQRIKGIEFARIYRSATVSTRVGGDFIDAFQVSGRRVAIALGDVSGKGLQAASITAMVRNTMRAHAVDGLPPVLVAEKTNHLLRLFTSVETFVTAFFGVLDTRSGRLAYVSAGHPPALVLSADGSIRQLDMASPVLGAFIDAPYIEGECVIEVGDCLLAYTDGVIEARGPEGLYGEDRLHQILASLGGSKPERIVREVFSAVQRYSGGEFRDDVAILALCRAAVTPSEPGAGQARFEFGDASLESD